MKFSHRNMFLWAPILPLSWRKCVLKHPSPKATCLQRPFLCFPLEALEDRFDCICNHYNNNWTLKGRGVASSQARWILKSLFNLRFVTGWKIISLWQRRRRPSEKRWTEIDNCLRHARPVAIRFCSAPTAIGYWLKFSSPKAMFGSPARSGRRWRRQCGGWVLTGATRRFAMTMVVGNPSSSRPGSRRVVPPRRRHYSEGRENQMEWGIVTSG